MTIKNTDFLHKGLLRFWLSEGTDVSGITAAWAKTLRISLAHLHSAKSLEDIQAGYGKLKNVKRLTGHAHRFSIGDQRQLEIDFRLPRPRHRHGE